MKGLDMLHINKEQKDRIATFARQYKQNARIFIEVVSFSDNRLIVRVEQKELVNGRQLGKKELEDRVRNMFKGEIPNDWKLTISAVDFDRADIESITIDWIEKQMSRLNLKQKDLVSHTGIDKATMSSVLNGRIELTRWHKTTFYYFFKYYELSNFARV